MSVGFFFVIANPENPVIQEDAQWPVRMTYARLAVALLRSMVANLEGLSCPIIIGTDGADKDVRKMLSPEYPNLRWHKIDVEKYEKAGKRDPRYFLLDAFSPVHDLDKIIVLGTDMICLSTTDQLIYRSHGPIAAWMEPGRGQYNTGSMVIERSLCMQEIYEALLAHDAGNEFGHDQAVVNSYFRGKIAALPAVIQAMGNGQSDPEADAKRGMIWLHVCHKYFSRRDFWRRNSDATIRLVEKYLGEYSLNLLGGNG
jgi:hypothetical protein